MTAVILSTVATKLRSRSKDDFRDRHFEAGLIVRAVSWYLSYRNVEELPRERDLDVEHGNVNR